MFWREKQKGIDAATRYIDFQFHVSRQTLATQFREAGSRGTMTHNSRFQVPGSIFIVSFPIYLGEVGTSYPLFLTYCPVSME